MGRDRRPHPVDEEARAALLGGRERQNRRAGVADGAETLEPGMALEVETAGLDGALGGREVARQDHGQPRFGIDEPLKPVERDPDPGGGVSRIDAGEDHPVEGQAGLVGGGAVHMDDPALDRPVVAEVEDRGGDEVGAQQRRAEAEGQEGQAKDQGGPLAEAEAEAQKEDAWGRQQGQMRAAGFLGEEEIEAHARTEEDRRPGEEMTPLAVDQTRKPGAVRMRTHSQPIDPTKDSATNPREYGGPAPCLGAGPGLAHACSLPVAWLDAGSASPAHGFQEINACPCPTPSSPELPLRPRGSCISARRGPRSSAGSMPGAGAGSFSSGSRIPTARGRRPRRHKPSSTG